MLLAFILALPVPARAAESQRLTLFLPDTDWPPYVTQEGEGGVFSELLSAIAEPLGYRVNVEFLPDRRGWEMLDTGQVDVHVKAKKWVADPDKYLWTEPFLEHEDVLLYSAKSDLEYTSPEALYGKSVAAIRSFRYPVFDPHFGPGKITRVDVGSPRAMLALLELGRVDAALVNRAETQWMLRHTPGTDPSAFRLDKTSFDTAQYRFLFSRKAKWEPLIKRINAALAAMKRDGLLHAMLNRYRYPESQ